MCLIALAHRAHPAWPLVVVANRDEFYERPSRAAHVWDDAPEVMGGRDLRAGGSWLAVRRGGRFAAVTNVRDGRMEGGPSRGALVAEFIKGGELPSPEEAAEYSGFHLIAGDAEKLLHVTNSGVVTPIAPGLFAISNAPVGVEWPKTAIARDALDAALARANDEQSLAEELIRFLSTARGGPIESEVFVSVPERGYGTRSSTVVIVGAEGGVSLWERSWPASQMTLLSSS
jgi:uncharacterized protein with NRDE domain